MCTFLVYEDFISLGVTPKRGTAESPGNSGFPVLRTLDPSPKVAAFPPATSEGPGGSASLPAVGFVQFFFGFGFTIQIGGTLTHACTNMQPHRGKDECSVMC